LIEHLTPRHQQNAERSADAESAINASATIKVFAA
jgi:hypothetical protein